MCMARGGAPTPKGHTAEDQICCILRLVYKNSRLLQTYHRLHSTDSLCSQVNVSQLILVVNLILLRIINSLIHLLFLRCMLTVTNTVVKCVASLHGQVA